MKSKTHLIRQYLLVFALMVGAVSLFTIIPSASAAILNPGDNPGEVAAATGGEGSLRQLVLRFINYTLTFLGILAVTMIIYGGFNLVYAGGNDEAVGNSKKIIMYALIGIIIILLSFAIVNTVLGAGTGVEP